LLEANGGLPQRKLQRPGTDWPASNNDYSNKSQARSFCWLNPDFATEVGEIYEASLSKL
jgi:hypothetical protein